MSSDRASLALRLQHPVFRRYLVSVRMLAALGAIALAVTNECEPLFLGAFAAFFLIGLRIESFPGVAHGIARLQPVFAALVLLTGIVDFFYLSNSFLLSAAHFLLFLGGVRLLSLRTNREGLGSVLVSSLMILSSSTLAVDWTFFLMLLIFLPMLIWTLMLYTILSDAVEAPAGMETSPRPKETSLPDARERAAFDAIAAVWSRLSSTVRRSAGVACAVALGCCLLVFIAFPRFNFQGFRGQFLQPVNKTGFTNQMNLQKAGTIFTDRAIVMRIEVPREDRENWTGYLRGGALELYDGHSFKRAPQTMSRLYATSRGEFSLGIPRVANERRLRQSIYLESMDTPMLFGAPMPLTVRMDRPFLETTADGAFQRRAGDGWRLHYDVVSYLSPETMAATRRQRSFLARASYVSTSMRQEHDGPRIRWDKEPSATLNRRLPDKRLPRLEALAKEIAGTAPSAVAAATLIANHLRTRCVYSLDIPVTPAGVDPLENFLFVEKKGHCEYFAASLCLMLRSLGHPARVVSGFLTNEWNAHGNYYIVRMKHAHAWVEVLDATDGWVMVDPSPREPDSGDADGQVHRLAEMWDYLNLRWNRYVLSYDFEKQVAIVRSITDTSAGVSMRIGTFFAPLQRLGLGRMRGRGITHRSASDVLTGLIVILGMGGVLGMVFFFFRRRRRDAVWFFTPLVRTLERVAGPRAPGETLRELEARARVKLGDRFEDARFLEHEYNRRRFDPSAPPTFSSDSAVRQRLARLRRPS